MALVTQTVVGNKEKKMLCYTVAIDNFPHSHPNFFCSHQPTTRGCWLCDNFISFFNSFSVACSSASEEAVGKDAKNGFREAINLSPE
jgi:hypothetical protein